MCNDEMIHNLLLLVSWLDIIIMWCVLSSIPLKTLWLPLLLTRPSVSGTYQVRYCYKWCSMLWGILKPWYFKPHDSSDVLQYDFYSMLLGLRKKTVAPGAAGLEDHLKNPGSTDLFGSSDAIVKHVLEVCCLCITALYYFMWSIFERVGYNFNE